MKTLDPRLCGDDNKERFSTFYESIKVSEVQIASEIQLYLDLQGFRGRGEEAAEVLYERIVEKTWQQEQTTIKLPLKKATPEKWLDPGRACEVG